MVKVSQFDLSPKNWGMNMRISDEIENFIKEMLGEDSPEVELKRNELAGYFNCAPSQINYVLATRFSPERGYLTESRRGGGGYIRIVRVVHSDTPQLPQLMQRIGDSLSEEEALRLISALRERGALSPEEASVMASAVSGRALSVPVSAEIKGALRARIMKSMLMTVFNGRRNAAGR